MQLPLVRSTCATPLFFLFLSNNFFVKLFEATRYRMKYLERHIFDFIPDISNIPDFPENISLQSIYNFFQISELERNFIEQNDLVFINTFILL